MQWLRIHNRIKQWRWYKSSAVKVVFLHLLIEANDERHYGEAHISIGGIAKATGETRQSVRYALDCLKSTGEIVCVGTKKAAFYKVANWEEYQFVTAQNTAQTTAQTTAQNTAQKSSTETALLPHKTPHKLPHKLPHKTPQSPRARARQNTDTDTEEPSVLEEEKNKNACAREKNETAPQVVPFPKTLDEVQEVAAKIGETWSDDDARRFIHFNRARGWKGVVNWKNLVPLWRRGQN